MATLESVLNRLRLPLVVLCGLFLALNWLAKPLGMAAFATGFAIAAVAFGSVHAIRSALDSIKLRELDVNLLMVLAGGGAAAIGEYSDAAILLFLFSLSSYLEAAAMARTESAISALMKLRPDKAILISDSEDIEIDIDDITPGQKLRVLPFERVPADGLLVSDSGSVNEGMMTGESVPIFKSQGDKLISGAQNLDTMIVMEVTSEAKNSALQRIMDLVAEAQTQKATSARMSEWFGTRYAVLVILAFLVSFAVRYGISHEVQKSFAQSLILLVALSPCAIVIASPAASLSALARAAKLGILVRNGGFLEEAGTIDLVAMDKTGTITIGKPSVTEITAFEGDSEVAKWTWITGAELQSESLETLAIIGATEAVSTHPIAEAIHNFAKTRITNLPQAISANVVPGLGIESTFSDSIIQIGQPKFFSGMGKEIPTAVSVALEGQRVKGRMIALALVIRNGQNLWVMFGLEDSPRQSAKATVDRLKSMGIEVVMLTGDHRAIAESVSKQVDIEKIHYELSPYDKHAIIQNWVSQGKKVMMLGDGVNDAPSLTSANLGVAMGGLGSEVALQASDVVLVQDRLERVPDLIQLGRKTRQTIRISLGFSIGVIVLLTLGSLFGIVPLPMAVVGHEGSTFIAMMNGLTLLKFSPKS